MDQPTLVVLGSGERVPPADCRRGELAGVPVFRAPDGRWLLPAFRGHAVAFRGELPDPDDELAFGDLVLSWVEAVRAHDWSQLGDAPAGQRLTGEDDWLELRTAMVRVGWGPQAAQAAWEDCRRQPYARDLPSAAGWAGGGWVVPAAPGEPDPVFARPVLEARGLLRWAYIGRWSRAARPPGSPLPTDPEPGERAWAELLSRFRQDHHTEASVEQATDLAVAVLQLAGLGPVSAVEAEDEPLPDRDVAAACGHPSPLVRAAAWFLLQAEGDRWLACGYGECQHHWAVEAEEDAHEQEEVLELASHGVANPVDAAHQRRRLLTLAFGDVNDVPLAGSGDLAGFIAFYRDWVARGRSEAELEAAARELRGDDPL